MTGLVVGLLALFGPRPMCCMASSRETMASMRARQFVEAHTEWSLVTGRDCPASLDELTRFMSSTDLYDPWGTPYAHSCNQFRNRR